MNAEPISRETGFLSGVPVLVRQRDVKSWILEEQLVYQGRDDTFVVPRGTVTDFASVPRVFAWLVPRYGRFTPAAVLHDHLWDEVPNGFDPVDADGIFRRALRELGVPFLLRWFMWCGVRWASLGTAARRRRWAGQLPMLLPFTVLALLVVALPGIAITAGYLVFLLFEGVAFVVLRLGRWMRPGPKQINEPRPSLRT